MTGVTDAIDLVELVQIESPDFYLGDPFPVFTRLRREAPVWYYEPLDLWLLTKYDDITLVSRTPEIFSNSDGILLNDFRYGNVLASFFPPEGENFVLADPPRHTEHRRIIAPAFSLKVARGLEGQVRDVCRRLLAEIEPEQPIDWTADVASRVPLSVIALLFGCPIGDGDKLAYWTAEMLKMGAAARPEEFSEAAANLGPMGPYFEEKFQEREAAPCEDFLGTIAAARRDGKINAETAHMFVSGAMAAGIDSTRNTMSGALATLATHPDEWNKLVADPTLMESATEEFIRWQTPVRGFGRTVRSDTALRGIPIAAGQRVFMLYASGNRDEDVFSDAGAFDVTRDFRQKPHISFGFGEHKCIGTALARMEIRILFEELVARFDSVELVGEPVRDRQLLQNAYVSVPVVFHTR
jgi:cytochrome P450